MCFPRLACSHFYRSVMQFDDALGDGQPQSHALLFVEVPVHLVEAVKDAGLFFSRNHDAVVANGNPHLTVHLLRAHPDLAPFVRAKLDGIVQRPAQRIGNEGHVGKHRRQNRWSLGVQSHPFLGYL